MKLYFKFFFLGILLMPSSVLNSQISPSKGVIAKKAMVVCARQEAAEVGIAILKKGGNAVDAAVAVEFALAVCYPEAGNIGGGGFMVVRFNDSVISALDYREKAPLTAFRSMYLDINNNILDNVSQIGQLASGVPGTVDGLLTAHKKFGKLMLSELIIPSIRMAVKGFAISRQQADLLNANADKLSELNGNDIPYIKKSKWVAGDTIKLPELAMTLNQILENGRDGFYSGSVADNIVNCMRTANGVISKADLKRYNSVWRKPISFKYKDFHIYSMPPPSSGGIAVAQLMGMIENYPVANWGWNSSRTAHLLIEAERRVYADRAAYLGDPDFVKIPVKSLIAKDYLLARIAGYDSLKATPSSSVREGGNLGQIESEETTHYSIVDANGNAVAGTTTLNGAFGSFVYVKGAGFFLNNEMDDFSIKPGFPNMYGLIGGDANAIQSEKRMLSCMTPTIVEKNQALYMVLGSPGGSTIITTVFQTLLNVIEFKMTMQEAVNAGRFHHQWLPDVVQYESAAFHANIMNELSNRGHTFKLRSSIGRVDAILIRPDKSLEGAADPRGDDTARGY